MSAKTAGQKDGAGLLERVTPGPWTIRTDAAGRRSIRGTARRVVTLDTNTTDADAELLTLAYDHALFGAAVMAGKASRATGYGKDAGRPCVAVNSGAGMAVEAFEVSLDAAGCPNLTPELRSALRKVVGSNG